MQEHEASGHVTVSSWKNRMMDTCMLALGSLSPLVQFRLPCTEHGLDPKLR